MCPTSTIPKVTRVTTLVVQHNDDGGIYVAIVFDGNYERERDIGPFPDLATAKLAARKAGEVVEKTGNYISLDELSSLLGNKT